MCAHAPEVKGNVWLKHKNGMKYTTTSRSVQIGGREGIKKFINGKVLQKSIRRFHLLCRVEQLFRFPFSELFPFQKRSEVKKGKTKFYFLDNALL